MIAERGGGGVLQNRPSEVVHAANGERNVGQAHGPSNARRRCESFTPRRNGGRTGEGEDTGGGGRRFLNSAPERGDKFPCFRVVSARKRRDREKKDTGRRAFRRRETGKKPRKSAGRQQ